MIGMEEEMGWRLRGEDKVGSNGWKRQMVMGQQEMALAGIDRNKLTSHYLVMGMRNRLVHHILTHLILINPQTWKSMTALPKSHVLNIGVSNFSPNQLKNIISSTGIKPFAHQMELHPYLQQSAWVATHKALGISLTAYSPLGNTNPTYDSKHKTIPALLDNKVLREIAEERNCTTAQVALKWGMGRGVSVIPKSSHKEWIRENLAAGECVLGHADLTRLRIVGRKWLGRFNNPSKGWGVGLFEGLDGV
ncbi:aldo keto reductase protein [Rutstroemia sp. NJR-2017a BVV2]|nr:aldo keto reductase protein [Rutstroemia sp. NJR-2017a BVV2]